MSRRVKTVSRIAQLIDHQKEIIEIGVLRIRNTLKEEKSQLAVLENQLEETIGNFEKKLSAKSIMSNQDMIYLYGVSSFLDRKIEQKNLEIDRTSQELMAQESLLMGAYRKKKVYDLFKNKIVCQEIKTADLLEQKSLDFFNLVRKSRR